LLALLSWAAPGDSSYGFITDKASQARSFPDTTIGILSDRSKNGRCVTFRHSGQHSALVVGYSNRRVDRVPEHLVGDSAAAQHARLGTNVNGRSHCNCTHDNRRPLFSRTRCYGRDAPHALNRRSRSGGSENRINPVLEPTCPVSALIRHWACLAEEVC
jgi:hypothetical protein